MRSPKSQPPLPLRTIDTLLLKKRRFSRNWSVFRGRRAFLHGLPLVHADSKQGKPSALGAPWDLLWRPSSHSNKIHQGPLSNVSMKMNMTSRRSLALGSSANKAIDSWVTDKHFWITRIKLSIWQMTTPNSIDRQACPTPQRPTQTKRTTYQI